MKNIIVALLFVAALSSGAVLMHTVVTLSAFTAGEHGSQQANTIFAERASYPLSYPHYQSARVHERPRLIEERDVLSSVDVRVNAHQELASAITPGYFITHFFDSVLSATAFQFLATSVELSGRGDDHAGTTMEFVPLALSRNDLTLAPGNFLLNFFDNLFSATSFKFLATPVTSESHFAQVYTVENNTASALAPGYFISNFLGNLFSVNSFNYLATPVFSTYGEGGGSRMLFAAVSAGVRNQTTGEFGAPQADPVGVQAAREGRGEGGGEGGSTANSADPLSGMNYLRAAPVGLNRKLTPQEQWGGREDKLIGGVGGAQKAWTGSPISARNLENMYWNDKAKGTNLLGKVTDLPSNTQKYLGAVWDHSKIVNGRVVSDITTAELASILGGDQKLADAMQSVMKDLIFSKDTPLQTRMDFMREIANLGDENGDIRVFGQPVSAGFFALSITPSTPDTAAAIADTLQGLANQQERTTLEKVLGIVIGERELNFLQDPNVRDGLLIAAGQLGLNLPTPSLKDFKPKDFVFQYANGEVRYGRIAASSGGLIGAFISAGVNGIAHSALQGFADFMIDGVAGPENMNQLFQARDDYGVVYDDKNHILVDPKTGACAGGGGCTHLDKSALSQALANGKISLDKGKIKAYDLSGVVVDKNGTGRWQSVNERQSSSSGSVSFSSPSPLARNSENQGSFFGLGNFINSLLSQTISAISVGNASHAIRGRVYKDINGNGIYDAGEPGIPNVPVSIRVDAVSFPALSTTETSKGANGNFIQVNTQRVYTAVTTQFGTFAATVKVVGSGAVTAAITAEYVQSANGIIATKPRALPSGYAAGNPVSGTQSITVAINSGDSNNVNFGLLAQTASGVIEQQRSFTHDFGNGPLKMNVYVTRSASTPSSPTLENSKNGKLIAEGVRRISGADKGASSLENSFTVSGQIFNDLNGNRIKDTNEPWFTTSSGIELYTAGTNSKIASGISRGGSSGEYALSGIARGTYDIKIVPPSGYVSTYPNVGGSAGKYLNYSVAQNSGPLNFGVQHTRKSISGVVWEDTDGDGVIDSGEAVKSGQQVALTAPYGGPYYRVTGSDGTYLYENMLTGSSYSYILKYSVPTGYMATTPSSRTVVLADSATVNFGIKSTAATTSTTTPPTSTTTYDTPYATPVSTTTYATPYATPSSTTTYTTPYTTPVSSTTYNTPYATPIAPQSAGLPTIHIVRGVVYKDVNKNGVMDGVEAPFANIPVSIMAELPAGQKFPNGLSYQLYPRVTNIYGGYAATIDVPSSATIKITISSEYGYGTAGVTTKARTLPTGYKASGPSTGFHSLQVSKGSGDYSDINFGLSPQ